MKPEVNITDSELEVLKELWLVPSLTARQLTDRLLERTCWSEPTIKTLLLRLLQKNAVQRTREGEGKVFTASCCAIFRLRVGPSLSAIISV